MKTTAIFTLLWTGVMLVVGCYKLMNNPINVKFHKTVTVCVAPKYINYFRFITQLEYTKITFQLVFIFKKKKYEKKKQSNLKTLKKNYNSLRFMPYNAIYGCSYLRFRGGGWKTKYLTNFGVILFVKSSAARKTEKLIDMWMDGWTDGRTASPFIHHQSSVNTSPSSTDGVLNLYTSWWGFSLFALVKFEKSAYFFFVRHLQLVFD